MSSLPLFPLKMPTHLWRRELTHQTWVLAFKKTCLTRLATDWCLGMDLGRVPTIPRTGESGFLCPHCTNNMFMLNTLLAFWKSVLLGHGRQRVPMWTASHKNRRGWVSNNILVDNISHVLPQLIARGIKCALHDSIRRGPLECRAWLPPDFTQAPCSVAFRYNKSQLWGQLCAELLNHCASLNLGIVLKSPDTQPFESQFKYDTVCGISLHFVRQISLLLCPSVSALAVTEDFILRDH